MKDILIKEYSNTKILNIESKKPQNTFNVNFVNGAFLEILGPLEGEYNVKFINRKTNRVVHESTVSNNMWTRTNIKYCVNWRVEVYSNGDSVFEHNWDPKGKRVSHLGNHLPKPQLPSRFRETYPQTV